MRGPRRGSLRLPEQLLLLLQGVEKVDRGGLLQAVGLEGRQHVDKLQEDLPDAHRQQVLVPLPSRVQRVTHTRPHGITPLFLNGPSCYTVYATRMQRGTNAT